MMALALMSAIQTTMLDAFDAALGLLVALLVVPTVVVLALALRGDR
jgi:hypothetical protein